jgi:hypothetical protein
MKKILKEPLLHFLILGLGLFVLFDLVAPDQDAFDSKVITVDRDALLTFVQFRSRAFEPQVAAERLDGLSEAELARLIDDYVQEEALHREALSLGVDQNDYVIKQRMIQSIRFITNGFVTANIDISDDDVAAYYAANRDDYYIRPYVTFTHVFFGNERREQNEALSLATTKLTELNNANVPFSEATRHGERFLYFVNYVERDFDFVISHFGQRMADAIFNLEADESKWVGPFESEYGAHLVLLARHVEGRYPLLEEVEGSVRQDAEREATTAAQDEAIQAIVDTYEVRREFARPAAESAQ